MERINARAQELGLLDTQHLNPSGLAWDGHYSSAFDLAYLAIYGRANSVLVEIVGTQSHVVHGSRTSCSEIPISCWVSSAWMA
jgi:D-alanyl-D-alanine carboxypeptidase (penicillin-binding protein 5/6)